MSTLHDPQSGRTMECRTSEPQMQTYYATFLDSTLPGKAHMRGGATCKDLECCCCCCCCCCWFVYVIYVGGSTDGTMGSRSYGQPSKSDRLHRLERTRTTHRISNLLVLTLASLICRSAPPPPVYTAPFGSVARAFPLVALPAALADPQHGAICLEAERFSNAVNIPAFPSQLCSPDEPYRQLTIYSFPAISS